MFMLTSNQRGTNVTRMGITYYLVSKATLSGKGTPQMVVRGMNWHNFPRKQFDDTYQICKMFPIF